MYLPPRYNWNIVVLPHLHSSATRLEYATIVVHKQKEKYLHSSATRLEYATIVVHK
jgi:hypothetical protein